MDRSNIPTKVEVRRGDLTNIESTKSFHILKRTVDFSQPGIVSGLTLQATAGSTTRIDLLAGYGYAPNGELVELATPLEGQPVGTLTVGEPSLVGLMYRETETKPGAAETDGVARPRRVVRSSEFKVFTASQWQALPASFDSDLTADARDRFLICGVVSLPTLASDPLSITVPPTFGLVKTIVQPSNLTGVVITQMTPATANSDPFPFPGVADPAHLVFQPSTGLLAYAAPFDGVDLLQASPFNGAGVGVPVNVSGGGTFNINSANGLVGLIVTVDQYLLPSTTAGASVTDDLAVTTLYTQTADRGSAKDDLHRHKTGSKIPTARDPHGLRFSDIATLLEELVGTLKIGTGYVTTLAQAEVPKIVIPANPLIDQATGSLRYQDLFETPGSSHSFGAALAPMRIRIYRSGTDSLCILLNAKVLNQGTNATFVRAAANGDNVDAQSAMIELSPFAVVFYARDAGSADTWDFTQWDRVQFFHSFSSNTTTFNGSLVLGTGLHTLAGRLTPRITTDYSVGAANDIRTEITSSSRSGGGGAIFRRFRSSVAEPTGINQADVVEDVLNANWNASTGLWTKDDVSVATKIEFSRAYLSLLGRLTGAAGSTFTDNIEAAGWERALQLDILNSFYRAQSTGGFGWLSAKTFTRCITGTAGMIPPTHETFYGAGGGNAVNPETNPEWFIKTTATALTRATWPLSLPNGAIVTACRLHFRTVTNPGGADYVRAAVIRSNHVANTGESFRAGGTPYDVIANSGVYVASALTLDETTLIRTIANGTFSYYVWIAATAAAGYEIEAIEVDYTLTEVTLP